MGRAKLFCEFFLIDYQLVTFRNILNYQVWNSLVHYMLLYRQFFTLLVRLI